MRGGPALKVVQVSGLVRSVHVLEGDSPGLLGGGGSSPTRGSGRPAVNRGPQLRAGPVDSARAVNLYHLRLNTHPPHSWFNECGVFYVIIFCFVDE